MPQPKNFSRPVRLVAQFQSNSRGNCIPRKSTEFVVYLAGGGSKRRLKSVAHGGQDYPGGEFHKKTNLETGIGFDDDQISSPTLHPPVAHRADQFSVGRVERSDGPPTLFSNSTSGDEAKFGPIFIQRLCRCNRKSRSEKRLHCWVTVPAFFPSRGHVSLRSLSITSEDVIDTLAELFAMRGVPRHMRSDNGPEFTVAAIRRWLPQVGVEALYVSPGSPWENGYAESFHSRLRDEFLAMEEFESLAAAWKLTRQWQDDYNRHRPHSSLGYTTPADYAAQRLIQPVEQEHGRMESRTYYQMKLYPLSDQPTFSDCSAGPFDGLRNGAKTESFFCHVSI